MLLPPKTSETSGGDISQKQIPSLRLQKIENYFPETTSRITTKIISNRFAKTFLKQKIEQQHHQHNNQTSNLTLNSTYYQTTNRTIQFDKLKGQSHPVSLKSSSVPKKKLSTITIRDIEKHYEKLNSNKQKTKIDRRILDKKRKLKMKIFQMVSSEKDNFCSTFERKNYLYNLKVLDYLRGDRRVKKAIKYHQIFRFGNDFHGEAHDLAAFYSETESFQDPKYAQKKLDEQLNDEEKRLILDDPLFFIKGNQNNSKLFTSISLTNRLKMEEKSTQKPKQNQTEIRDNTIYNHERTYLRKLTRRLTRAEIKENNHFVKKKKIENKEPNKQAEISNINNKIKKILYNKRTVDLNTKKNNSFLHVEQTMRDLNQQILKQKNKKIEHIDLNDVFIKKPPRTPTRVVLTRNRQNNCRPCMNYVFTYNTLNSKEMEFVNQYSQTIRNEFGNKNNLRNALYKTKENEFTGRSKSNSMSIRAKFQNRTRLLSHSSLMNRSKTISGYEN